MQCSQPAPPAGVACACVSAALRRLRLHAGVVLALVLWALPAAGAEQHALLIGVNSVEALPQRLQLRGPANDVTLMRQALLQRGFDARNITVLAQGTPAATAAPTQREVLQAMERLAQRVRPGDTVVLHLAGHGVQVPQAMPARQASAPEPDGLDEVFLLQDSGSWDAAQAQLPRGLRDDDIGAWIDALVDRGARVFAIFDSCHAAGMARAPAGPTRWRSVAAVELGVPLSAMPVAQPIAPAGIRRPGRTDGRVLAYAARGHELAGEEWLPKGASLARARLQGVFSFELAGALMAGARTAEDLLAALRERYAAAGRHSPTPLVLGSGPLTAR